VSLDLNRSELFVQALDRIGGAKALPCWAANFRKVNSLSVFETRGTWTFGSHFPGSGLARRSPPRRADTYPAVVGLSSRAVLRGGEQVALLCTVAPLHEEPARVGQRARRPCPSMMQLRARHSRAPECPGAPSSFPCFPSMLERERTCRLSLIHAHSTMRHCLQGACTQIPADQRTNKGDKVCSLKHGREARKLEGALDDLPRGSACRICIIDGSKGLRPLCELCGSSCSGAPCTKSALLSTPGE